MRSILLAGIVSVILPTSATACIAWRANDTMVNTCNRPVGVGYATYNGPCRAVRGRPLPCSFMLSPGGQQWIGARVSQFRYCVGRIIDSQGRCG